MPHPNAAIIVLVLCIHSDNGINVARKSASVVPIRNIGFFRLAYASVSSNEWKEMHACINRVSEAWIKSHVCGSS